MTRQEAQARAEAYLQQLQRGRSYELVIVDKRTREEDFGWIFFYNTKQFVETGDMQWALGGNAPLIVDRELGEIHVTGTAHPLDHYIREFRRANQPR